MEQEKPIVDVSERKEAFFDYGKKTILKRPKICIFPKELVHGFCQKIETFFIFCFNINGTRKTDCRCFRTKRSLFRLWKKTILKRPKICIFPKELDHGLCRKIKTFSNFSFNSKWMKTLI